MLCVNEKVKKQGTAVALGYFDGIHIGHRGVLETALKKAKENSLVPVVLLFDVHPRKLICGKAPEKLITDEKKRYKLAGMGFEVVDFDFAKAMNSTADEFVRDVLIGELNAKFVCCGYDFRFGKGGEGTPQYLEDRLREKGAFVYVTEGILCDGEIVSSSRIRNFISKGEIEKANKMLGEYFSYNFTVVKGDGIGHTWGFPTINQHFPKDFIVPEYGVYASRVTLGGVYYPSVTNVGVRPTVNSASCRFPSSYYYS